MKEITITVKNPTGLHTRPGTEFVQRAKAFQSDIFIRKGEKEANGKGQRAGLSLDVIFHATVLLTLIIFTGQFHAYAI